MSGEKDSNDGKEVEQVEEIQNETADMDQEEGVVELSLEEVISQDIAVEVEIDGDLELKEVIGEGYYGPVYRVGDEDGNVDFAIKALPNEISSDPDLLDRVKNSFDEASFLNHQNIACVSHLHEVVDDSPVAQELGVCNGSQLIVMEYIDGLTVHDWIQQFPEKKADFDSAVEICTQMAQALDYAHEKGMVHLYLKPENVMITVDGEVKILDFGIASEVHKIMNQFKTGENKDKIPTHFAPEQWMGRAGEPATDQYALATIFYQLISGDIPFASALSGGVEVFKNCIINDVPEPIPELSMPQWCALKKGLAKDPEDRYPSCSDMMRSIVSQSVEGAGSEKSESEEAFDPSLLIAVVVIIVALVVVMSLGGGSEDDVVVEEPATKEVVIDEVKVLTPQKTEAVNVAKNKADIASKANAMVDSDNDGITDNLETQFGLDPKDPTDALKDADGDGFNNITEILGKIDGKKSNPNDALSHPILAYHLTIIKIAQPLIPLIVKKVEAFGAKKNWSALIKYEHPKGIRTESKGIGEIVKLKDRSYKVANIKPNFVMEFDKSVNSKIKVDKSSVVLKETDRNRQIKAVVKTKNYDKNAVAVIIDKNSGRKFNVSQLTKITLGNNKIGTEVYSVVKVDTKKNEVVLISEKDKSTFILKAKK